jgi:DNA-directed RNA polymerase specialized sigma24 family protein
MSCKTDEWPFLDDAWKYALVLTGREADALESVRATLALLARRTDAADPAREKRILFSSIYRSAKPTTPASEPPSAAEQAVDPLHNLPEPGRSALTLLCLGLFSGEELAGVLGEPLPDLARALGDARHTLAAPSAS